MDIHSSVARLLQQLPHIRAAWGADTVHADWLERWETGQSTGQCGPTAYWVRDQLRADGYNADVHSGYVDAEYQNNVSLLNWHAWTVAYDPNDANNDIVIDLTAGQCPVLSRLGLPFVAHHRTRLVARGIHYRTRRVWPEPDTLTLPRYQAFKTRMEAALATPQ